MRLVRPNIQIKNDFGIEHLLVHTASLYRKQKTRNPAGGWTESWVKVRDFNCRFTVYTPRDMATIQEQKQVFPVYYKVFTKGDEDIIEGDRILFQNKNYDVVNVINPSFANHHLEIQVTLTPKVV
jgi:SPP1 family predicted phage head-tail adaptor